jgi:hypothetical protein
MEKYSITLLVLKLETSDSKAGMIPSTKLAAFAALYTSKLTFLDFC